MRLCDKKDCIGCLNCKIVCPQNAITVRYDSVGFKYPVIKKDKCINCSMCRKVCPILNKIRSNPLNECYACKNKNDEIKRKSSSGGIFYPLAKEMLNRNGIVYGCVWENRVKHKRITSINEIEPLLGSKYVQSDLRKIFINVKMDLNNGREVLFVGTPCQIVALKFYLKKDYQKLFLIDFICHGVGSPKVFNMHLKNIEEKFGRISKVSFRNKNNGWEDFSFQALGNREYIQNKSTDNFLMTFLRNLCLRDSCYSCNFKKNNRVSDLTLGDFWNIKKVNEDFYDYLGVSTVIVNTKKGEHMFKKISDEIDFISVNYNDISNNNIALNNSAILNSHRELFIKDIKNGKNLKGINKEYFNR